MSQRILQLVSTIFCCIVIAGWAFCPVAATGETAQYPIYVENPEGLRLFFVESGIRGDDLLVSGKVRRSRLPGHVASAINVFLIGTDGKIVDEKAATYAPRSLSRRRGHDEGYFTARFSGDLDRVAIIRVGGPAVLETDD